MESASDSELKMINDRLHKIQAVLGASTNPSWLNSKIPKELVIDTMFHKALLVDVLLQRINPTPELSEQDFWKETPFIS